MNRPLSTAKRFGRCRSGARPPPLGTLGKQVIGSQPFNMAAKPSGHLLRREIRNTLTLAGVLVATTLGSCGRGDREAPAVRESQRAEDPIRLGPFAQSSSMLYRLHGETLVPLAALPGWGAAPDTLGECAAAMPDLEARRFRGLTLSPDSAWAIWRAVGPGACVGVVGLGEPPVRVFGHWSAAALDSVTWAPAGRYLTVWLRHPGGRRSLSVFDAIEGVRLEMPWELECSAIEDCDVIGVAWLGGTLLNVNMRLGPAEVAVPYEVNVGLAPELAIPRKETE